MDSGYLLIIDENIVQKKHKCYTKYKFKKAS